MTLQLTEFIHEHFGFEPTRIKELGCFGNFSYKVSTATQHYILKTYPGIDMLGILLQETEVLLSIHRQGDFLHKYSKPLPFKNGEYVEYLYVNEQCSLVRLLTYVPGEYCMMCLAPTSSSGSWERKWSYC